MGKANEKLKIYKSLKYSLPFLLSTRWQVWQAYQEGMREFWRHSRNGKERILFGFST